MNVKWLVLAVKYVLIILVPINAVVLLVTFWNLMAGVVKLQVRTFIFAFLNSYLWFKLFIIAYILLNSLHLNILYIFVTSISGGEVNLIFANRIEIRKGNPSKSEFSFILDNLDNAIALDFHYDLGLLFWSDVSLDVIKRVYLNGSNIQTVVECGLKNTGKLEIP